MKDVDQLKMSDLVELRTIIEKDGCSAAWDLMPRVDAIIAKVEPVYTLRPIAEYHEDMGFVLWYILPLQEPPYVGSPLCEDWPGYHTHFADLPMPENPQ